MREARNLWQLIARRADQTPDALFAVDDRDRRMTFSEYRHASERVAAGLIQTGIEKGTNVSWMLPTGLEAMVLVGGLARIGAVQNPILPIYREREVEFIARQSKAVQLFVPGTFRGFDYAAMANAVAERVPGLEVRVLDGALPEGDPTLLPAPPDAASEPIRWIFYTSGTTADPKGALHTDATLMAASRGMAQALALSDDDRVALVFPFTHVGGICWLAIGLLVGCAHVVVPVFDKDSIALLARHDVTQATAGTAFHQAYLAAQRELGEARLFPRVRSFPGGGAPKPPQLHFDLKKEMGGAGIVSGYGLTECPIAAMNWTTDRDEKLAHTEGRPNPIGETELKVRTRDGGIAGPREEGEICARGPQLCKGYLDEALNTAFDADGFFRTGDLGYLDGDGYVVITGRLKDVIIRNGENISAKEVEDLLYQHSKVEEVAVIGLPDAKTGERACAVVRCRDSAQPLAFEEMVAFLEDGGLMIQKIPEQLEVRAEIPRNPTGKILKHQLREEYGA